MRRVLALFLVLSLALMACSSDDSASEVEAPDRDAIYIVGGEPITLDPHLVTDAGSNRYIREVYRTLVHFDIDMLDADGNVVASGMKEISENQDVIERFQDGELQQDIYKVPGLAVELPDPEFNDDGTVSYTFTLREDAKFSSGRQVTANDIAYSIERAADPRTGSTTAELYLGDIAGVMDMQRGRIPNRVHPDSDQVTVDLPGLEVVDERTIRITTEGYKPDFLWKLTYPTAAAVDKVQTEGPGRWTDRPSATGPYTIVRRDISEIVLERNPHYYGDEAKVERIVFYLAGGSTFQRFQNHEVDFTGVGLDDINELIAIREGDSPLSNSYFETTEMSTFYVGFNTQNPPFDDPDVRRAFSMAVDKDAIAAQILHDLVVPAHGVLPPGIPGYNPNVNGLSYDPEKARELLENSQYGDNLPRVRITVAGTGGTPGLIVENVVQSWRQNLGVNVEIEQRDFATMLDEIRRGTFQMFSMGWIADYPDPGNFLDLKLHGERSGANNETRYSNPEVNALLDEARTERDEARRIELYRQAEELIIQDVPWLTLYHGKTSILVQPYLCGYFPTPIGVSVLPYVHPCEN